MSELSNDPATAPARVRKYLHMIAQTLRDEPRLSVETQRLLADLTDELSRLLESDTVPATELDQIAAHVAELVRAAHRGESNGVVARVQDRLETAATAVETRAPLVAGLTRRLIETLAELGI